MAGDATTIARPYAEAVFKYAIESNNLDLWSKALDFLVFILGDSALLGLIANPKLSQQQKAKLLIEIGETSLNDPAKHFVELLAKNNRLNVIVEIRDAFELLKLEHIGTIDVTIDSAYELEATQIEKLSDALERKFGQKVRLQTTINKDLIGGFKLTAGDTVIDGSVSSQLKKMSHELGIQQSK
tara:strand:+ start:16 stop:567 length:552 start_codon:yes stop_codon:yes gene_type:complete